MRAKLSKTTIRNLKPRAARYEVADTDTPSFRVRVAPTGVKTFALRYRNASNKTCLFTIGKFGDLTPEAAREIAQKKLAEIVLGQDPAAEKQATRREAERLKASTLGTFLDDKYAPWVTANRKTGAGSVKRIRSVFPDLLDKDMTAITPWIIEKWRKAKLNQGRTTATINRDLGCLKSALARAVDWDVIDRHPLSKVKPGKVDHAGIVRYLSADEEARLRKALVERDASLKAGRDRGNAWREERGRDPLPDLGPYADHLEPMVLVSLNTGLRQGELFGLTWQDVNLDSALLTVRGSGAKSGNTRHVPLNSEAVAVLKTWKSQTRPTGLVFTNKDGERFTDIKTAWRHLLKSADIAAFRWHDLRHHFASRLVQAGVDLNTVRELLGHADLKMTLRYAHLAPAHKSAAVARLVADA